MTARQDAHLTPRQDLALRFLALRERTTVAAQRRTALRERCNAALEVPEIAAAVDAALESQIQRAVQRLTDPSEA